MKNNTFSCIFFIFLKLFTFSCTIRSLSAERIGRRGCRAGQLPRNLFWKFILAGWTTVEWKRCIHCNLKSGTEAAAAFTSYMGGWAATKPLRFSSGRTVPQSNFFAAGCKIMQLYVTNLYNIVQHYATLCKPRRYIAAFSPPYRREQPFLRQ